MIQNKKTFYAIGQGCFYSEKIYFENEIKTILYDCGSLNISKLKKEVSQSGLLIIDYLVISHFHRDHINGIDELKKYFKIKNVAIPKIDVLDIVFYLKVYSKKRDKGFRDLILNPNNYFKGTNENNEAPNIIFVNSGVEQTEIPDSEKIPKDISHINNIPVLKYDNQIIWILRFYVDKGSFGKNKLTTMEQRLIKSISTNDDYEKNLNELKKIYNKICENDVNLTSMTMASAPKDNWFYRNPISIMNGDILLDTEERILEYTNHFSDFRKFRFDFHIPHHGSHKNLKRPINEWITNKGIIMSGYENSYGHPSGIILKKFSDSKIPTKTLTEFDRNYVRIFRY